MLLLLMGAATSLIETCALRGSVCCMVIIMAECIVQNIVKR